MPFSPAAIVGLALLASAVLGLTLVPQRGAVFPSASLIPESTPQHVGF